MTSTPVPTSLPINIPHPFPWAIKRQRECYSLVAQSWIEAGRIRLTDVMMISEMFRGFMRYSAVSSTRSHYVRMSFDFPGCQAMSIGIIIVSVADKVVINFTLDAVDNISP
jgi:hypothetical protein